jgi:hypothetical protein
MIALRLLAWVHYPSYLRYELHKMEQLKQVTMRAADACRRVHNELRFSKLPKAAEMMETVQLMLTLLESRMCLIGIRCTALNTNRLMFEAFKITPEDKMFDLDTMNDEFEKAILSLGQQLQGANQ